MWATRQPGTGTQVSRQAKGSPDQADQDQAGVRMYSGGATSATADAISSAVPPEPSASLRMASLPQPSPVAGSAP